MTYDNDNLPIEEWRQVPSLPDVEASSHGRVRRKPHTGIMPHGGARLYKAEPRFGVVTQSSAEARSLHFAVYYRGIGNIKCHFAVCEAFHGPNPDGKKGVRHLNENGLDNRPSNLCWASQKTNLNDPEIKWYHRNRVSPWIRTGMTKREKRAGIYESILDIGIAQKAAREANDNRKLEVAV